MSRCTLHSSSESSPADQAGVSNPCEGGKFRLIDWPRAAGGPAIPADAVEEEEDDDDEEEDDEEEDEVDEKEEEEEEDVPVAETDV